MRSARLFLALDGDAVALPDTGTIAVIGPRAGDDLSALPRDRLRVVQGFRPDHDWFAAQGLDVTVTLTGPVAAAVVCLPRARAGGQALIAAAHSAVRPGGPILIDGLKTDGIDAMIRACRARAPLILDPLAKAHGKIFAVAADPAAFADWAAAPGRTAGGFLTAPGVFSADGVDPGSALLAETLPAQLPGIVVDSGAGWGYLSAAVLSRDGVREVHLIEADHAALDCARANIADVRARFHWADATTFRPPVRADWAVCNPPFHTTRAADPGLGQAFIRSAAAMLGPAGVLYLVANRHLPYERVLASAFAEVATAAETKAFKVFRAVRPLGNREAERVVGPRRGARSASRIGR